MVDFPPPPPPYYEIVSLFGAKPFEQDNLSARSLFLH